MKPILAFETSSPALSIALWTPKGPVLEKTIHGFMTHAENLLPAVDQLLKKKKLSIQDVGTLLIGRGPGSFTGLRVGFATLKGFLAVAPYQCFGTLSLDLIAENSELPEGSYLCAALDARRDKVFSRLYKKTKTGWKAEGEAQTIAVSAWADSLPASVTLAGDGAHRYSSVFEKNKGKKMTLLPEKEGYPKASKLIDLFLTSPKKLQPLETLKDFVPLYFRLSEAEERMNAGELKKYSSPGSHAGAC